MATELSDYERFVATFWAAFGEGADMPMKSSCVDEAYALLYYKNILDRLSEFKSDPQVVENAKKCCRKAGKLAAALAAADDKTMIEREHFRDACTKVKTFVDALGTGSGGNFGRIC